MLKRFMGNLFNGFKPAKFGKPHTASKRRPSAGRAIPCLELLEDRCLLSAAVAIVTNPISHTLVAGQTATFTAAATGSPTPTVQWEMSPAGSSTFTPLTAGGKFSGVTTDKLTITGINAALSGDQFEAVFTNGASPSLATTAATLTVLPAPTIGKLTQTGWTNNLAGFTGTMTISGGIGPYTIASDSGLPTGLTAFISGNTIRFSGTPNGIQAFPSGSITITDSVGDQASQLFSITINPRPTISHMSNNNWTEGLANFTGAMTITGGTGPFTIVGSSNLPPGVTPIISGNLIKFTGTPNVATTFSNCNVTIMDASGAFVGKTFVIDVTPALILGNPTKTEWTVGEPSFAGTLAVGGGTGTVTLQSASGLPTGLTAKVSGRTIVFTGTPTTVGTFAHASVTVVDADGATVTETFSITMNPAPTLSTLNQLVWTGGEPGFTGTITIKGGTGPYKIASYGTLPFTPEIRGNTIDFTGIAAAAQTLIDGFLTISDSTGAVVSETIPTFEITPQPTVSTLSTTQWTVGQPGFNGGIIITNGTAPFTIVSSRGLPTGLTPTVDDFTIALVGTPTVAHAFTGGVIAVKDSGGATFNVPVNVTINPALAFTTTSLPALTPDVAYNTTLKGAGGTGADTYTLTSGSLPPGLTLDSHGKISGVSAATKAYTFTVTLTDIIGAHVSTTFTIAGNPAIAIGNVTQPQWTAGEPGYNSVMAISGGDGSFAITKITGLPPGLTASISGANIVITGTPTTAGTFATGSITIADAGAVTATQPFTITINPAPTLTALSATAWTGNVVGFNGTITIKGGTGPYTITSQHGLPFTPVLSGNTILFTGTAAAGYYAGGSITVVDKTGAAVTEMIAPITINAQATITHLSLNNWTTGLANFAGVATIVGGTGPFTVTEFKNVPPGLTPVVVGDTIQFKGTPSVAGNFGNVTVTIEDAAGIQKTKSFVIDLATPIKITTSHLPAWHSGVSYSATLNATGGTGPDTFTLTSGALPPGLTLKPNGKISGIATAIGSFTFTVTVTDVLGAKFSESFTL